MLRDTRSPFYHAFSNLTGPAVVREDVIVQLSRGRRVLHFGFLDAPFTREKLASNTLLHSEIQSVATYAFGIDISASSLEVYRAATHDFNNDLVDVQEPMRTDQIDFLTQGFDVIMFGEILEHLLNPGIALNNLLRICRSNSSCELCITTPNALYLGSFLPALFGREIVHPEHYYYYSPHTLGRLLADAGFGDVRIGFYSDPSTLAAPGLTKAGLIALCRAG